MWGEQRGSLLEQIFGSLTWMLPCPPPCPCSWHPARPSHRSSQQCTWGVRTCWGSSRWRPRPPTAGKRQRWGCLRWPRCPGQSHRPWRLKAEDGERGHTSTTGRKDRGRRGVRREERVEHEGEGTGRKLERREGEEMMRNAAKLLIHCFKFQPSRPQVCRSFRGEFGDKSWRSRRKLISWNTIKALSPLSLALLGIYWESSWPTQLRCSISHTITTPKDWKTHV